jgi:hypothetical protein
LRFHYLLRFWGTEYACQPEVSAMFGEHYGSLLASSGSLVDLEKELQSAYMSRKVYQFSLTWNLSNSSKSVEDQKKLQLKKLVLNYTFFLHKFSVNFFHPLAIFPGIIKFRQLFSRWKINCSAAHLSVALRLTPSPPVGAVLPPSCHPSRHHSSHAC